MVKLKLDGFTTSFSLKTPLSKNTTFLKWKERATEADLIKLLSTSMHNQKVIYYASIGQGLELSPVIYDNLIYLANLCGFNEDLEEVALKVAENENYDACETEEQKPKKKR